MANLSPIANFERIETLVNSSSFHSLPITTIKKELDSLLRDSPTSGNPQFQQRWDRVNEALRTRIDAEQHWYERPLGLVAIGVVITLLSTAALWALKSE